MLDFSSNMATFYLSYMVLEDCIFNRNIFITKTNALTFLDLSIKIGYSFSYLGLFIMHRIHATFILVAQ